MTAGLFGVQMKNTGDTELYYVKDWDSGNRYAMDGGKFYWATATGTLMPTDNSCLLLPCMQHIRKTGCISLLFSSMSEYAIYDTDVLLCKKSTDGAELRRILCTAMNADACMDVLMRQIDRNVTQRIIVLDTEMCQLTRTTEGWEHIFG